MPLIRLNPDLRVINRSLRINKENIREPTAGLSFDLTNLAVKTLFAETGVLARCFLLAGKGEERNTYTVIVCLECRLQVGSCVRDVAIWFALAVALLM